jgi:hypothetical protein
MDPQHKDPAKMKISLVLLMHDSMARVRVSLS